MANISRNVEINIREGSNSLKDEFAFLKSGRASINVEFSGNGFQQLKSLKSDIGGLQSSLTSIEGSLGTISTKLTNLYSQISGGARQATQAVNGLSQAQSNLGQQSSASSAFVKQLQQQRREIEATAVALSRRGIDASSLNSSDSTIQRQFDRIAQAQARNESSPVRQATSIARSEAVIRRLESSFDTVNTEEALASLFGSGARRAVRISQAAKLTEANPGIIGLGDRLNSVAANGELKQIFDARRLLHPETLKQVGIGAITGGVEGAGIATIGGAFGGPAGAAIGSFAAQLAEQAIAGFSSKLGQFREAGEAYSEALLSVASNLQGATRLINSGSGQALGPEQIGRQVAFREAQAEGVLNASRAALSRLGLTGENEALIVRGTQTGLNTKGIRQDPETVSQIARALSGFALANNLPLTPKILQTDIPRTVAGEGTNTDLGRLLPPDVALAIRKAQTSSELLKALSPLQKAADFYETSQNPVAVQRRLQGANNQFDTSFGRSQINAAGFGLRAQEFATNRASARQSAELFGTIAGGAESIGRIGSTAVTQGLPSIFGDAISLISNPKRFFSEAAAEFRGKQIKPEGTKPDSSISEEDLPENVINRRLTRFGLDKKFESFDTTISPFAQRDSLAETERLANASAETKRFLPFIAEQRAAFNRQISDVESRGFSTSTTQGQLQRNAFERSSISSQIGDQSNIIAALQAQQKTAATAEDIFKLKGRERDAEAEISALRAKQVDAAQQELSIKTNIASRSLGSVEGFTDKSTFVGASSSLTGRRLDDLRALKARDPNTLPEELAALDSQRLVNSEQQSKAFKFQFASRLTGVDSDTAAGSLLASRLRQSEAQQTASNSSRLIAQYQAEIASGRNANGGTLNDFDILQRRQLIEKNSAERSAANVTSAKESRNQALAPSQISEAQAELQLALNQSARLIADEASRRAQLNVELASAKTALEGFADSVKSQKAGGANQIAQLAKKIKNEGGSVSGAVDSLNEDDLQKLQLSEDAAKFNELTKKFGVDSRASSPYLNPLEITNRSDTQFAQGIDAEKLKLQTGVRDTANSLADLAAAFKAKAAQFQGTIVSKTSFLKGAAEPGAAQINPETGPVNTTAASQPSTVETGTAPSTGGVFDSKNIYGETPFSSLPTTSLSVQPQINVPATPTSSAVPELKTRGSSNNNGQNQPKADNTAEVVSALKSATDAMNAGAAAMQNLSASFK